MAWLLPGYCLVMAWLWPGYCLVMAWLWPGYCLVMAWLLPGYCLVMAWLWPGYCLVIAWLWPGYCLVIAWLWPGYGHSTWHNISLWLMLRDRDTIYTLYIYIPEILSFGCIILSIRYKLFYHENKVYY